MHSTSPNASCFDLPPPPPPLPPLPSLHPFVARLHSTESYPKGGSWFYDDSRQLLILSHQIQRVRNVHGGRKSLSVAIADEFYTFDSMEIRVEIPAAKLILTLNFKVERFSFSCIVFHSYRQGKTFFKNLQFFWKMIEKFFNHLTRCGRARANSDFILLIARMSISRNFHIHHVVAPVWV